MTVLYGIILFSDFLLRSMVAIYLLRHSNLNQTSFFFYIIFLRSLSVSFLLRCSQCGVIVYFSVFSLLFIDFHPSISGRIRWTKREETNLCDCQRALHKFCLHISMLIVQFTNNGNDYIIKTKQTNWREKKDRTKYTRLSVDSTNRCASKQMMICNSSLSFPFLRFMSWRIVKSWLHVRKENPCLCLRSVWPLNRIFTDRFTRRGN